MFDWKVKDIKATNAIILGDKTEEEGRPFKARFLQAGLVKYNFGVCLLKKETIDRFVNTFMECPVIIGHKDDIDKNDVKGTIKNIWFSPEDGWFWCSGIIDEEAAKKVEKGFNVSCQYRITEYTNNDGDKLHNGNRYDKEILNGVFEHLAIVENPRYEDAYIAVNAIMATNEDKWITIGAGEDKKGRHVLVKDGQTKEEAVKEKLAEWKEKGEKKETKDLYSDENFKENAKRLNEKFGDIPYSQWKKDVQTMLKKYGKTEKDFDNAIGARKDAFEQKDKKEEPKKDTSDKPEEKEEEPKVEAVYKNLLNDKRLIDHLRESVKAQKADNPDAKIGDTQIDSDRFISLYTDKLSTKDYNSFSWEKAEDMVFKKLEEMEREAGFKEDKASNSFLEQFKDMLYTTLAEGIVDRLGELRAKNEHKWITIHPHGKSEDGENDYRRLKIEDGETPKEAIDRVYKKEEKKDKREKQEIQENILGSDYKKLKSPQEQIDYLNKIDVSTLNYKGLEELEEEAELLYDNRNIDITLRKEAQKILYKITDRKHRQRAIEKSQEVGGYTEKLQKLANFSQFSDISSFPTSLQKHIYDNYKKVYDKYPQLSQSGYGSLKKEDLNSSTYANNLSLINAVTLNSSWYDDLEKLKKGYAEDVQSQWHPQGTNYNSIITHELGHGLLSYIQSNLGISGKAIRSKVLKKLGLHIKDINTHLSRYPNNSKNPVHEFFAEAFAEYMDSPNPRPLAVEFGKEIERIFSDLDRS